MTHIKFKGLAKQDTAEYDTPVEKIVPIERLGLQFWANECYWAEVYYNSEKYRSYKIEKDEYNRIARLLEKKK